MTRLALVLALVVALAGPASARPLGQVAFRSFTPEDGLTNLVVLAIAEDRDGALWIGTDDGLFRLDGERAIRFGPAAGVTGAHIYGIAAAPDGALCLASERGLACGRDGKFAAVPVPGGVKAFARTDDALWIAGNQGLYVRRGSAPPELVAGAVDGEISLLWADARGVIAGRPGALAIAEPGRAWTPLELELPDEPRELRRDPSGALWLRSASRVWRVRAGERRAQDVTLNLGPGGDTRFGATLTVSPDGLVMVATAAGIATFRGDHWDLLGASRGLPVSGAHVLYHDRAGDLWIGSVGLHRQLGRGLLERYTLATGLPGEAAWSIARGLDGELLVGTSRCLAHVVAGEGSALGSAADGPRGSIAGTWACIAGTEGHVVRSIVVMPDGELFFGGVPAAIYRRALDGTVSEVAQLTSPRMIPRILSMAAAPDGTLWIGADAGIWRRAPGATSPTLPVAPPGGDPMRFVSAIIADGPRMWFAGHEGLRVHEAGRWTRLTSADGLRATEVRYVARRRDGRLCVLYDQGLGVTCFRYAGGRLTELAHVAVAEGLDATMGYSLGEDRAGRLWIGTGAGLRVIADDAAVGRFTARDGHSEDNATAMGFRLDDDGGLWFGSSGGLTHVAAERYRGPPPPPAVRMLGLAVSAPAHDLHASFIANYYVDADVEYQVRLRPRDEAWTTAKAREVRYAALPPGDYELELQARARSGTWSAVTRAPFAIPAAWWQTRWIWLAGGALALGVAAILVLGWQRATLRLRTRLLAHQADASFRAFVASMPDVVIVRRADGAIYLNEAARRLFGDHDGERALLRRIHPGDRRRAIELLRRTRPGELVELRVGPDDDWRDLEVTHQTIELVGALAHVVVGRDVTERRRLQAKVLIADRMASLGTLAAGVGHEINNPLAYVRGNLEVIEEIVAGDDLAARRADLGEAVRDAIDGADRVRAIVRDLDSFNHRTEERRVEVALDDVIAQAARLTHNELRHRAELVLDTQPVRVLADPGRLTQVVVNLLINAAHAVAPGAADRNQIVVRTRGAAGRATLEVEDHGVGMEPEVAARVFDPFFTTKQVGAGTGLGLSVCHGIVTGLGGQISVDSQRGRGTTVRISLPACAASVAAAAPRARTAPGPSERPRVLVVDDEPAVGNVLGRMLRTECDVTVLTGGEDALQRLAGGERYDVIVTDVMMPVMTGLELRERLLATDPDQARRLVFVTGGAFNPAMAERLDALDVPRMAKPLAADELRRMIHDITAAGRAG